MSRKRIIVNPGDRYGMLTIVKETTPDKYFRKFICLCDCGKERNVYFHNLRSGFSQSCGCRRDRIVKETNTIHTQENLIGVKHGIWTIIKSKDEIVKRVVKTIQTVTLKKVIVECELCGEEKEILFNSLIFKKPAKCLCQKTI
jgi:hypothetical protein